MALDHATLAPHPIALTAANHVDHEFKSHPDVFWPAARGEKTFEFRKDDRGGYQVGQTVRIRCYDPDHGYYGHPPLDRVITNVLYPGQFGLQDGYCIMSLRPLNAAAAILFTAPVNQNTTATTGKDFPKTGMSFPGSENGSRTALTEAGQKVFDVLVKARAVPPSWIYWPGHAAALNAAAALLFPAGEEAGLREALAHLPLAVSEPHDRHAPDGSILITDAVNNDIAVFFHRDQATVGQSYEVALAFANQFVSAANSAGSAGEDETGAREDAVEIAAAAILACLQRECGEPRIKTWAELCSDSPTAAERYRLMARASLATQLLKAEPPAGVGVLARLRSQGWAVAVHNDYRLAGEARTFWLLTHANGRWIKGEGRTDDQALAEAALSAAPAARSVDGFVLVPREPTEAMAKASRLTTELPEGGRVTQWGVNAWAAMIAAAPAADGVWA